MIKNSRNAAIQALLRVKENEGYSNIVIDKTLKEFDLDKRDSSLASAIFYGVLEKRITLDYYIRKVLDIPNKKLDENVKIVIYCGAYQIFFMDKIPESAIVNEAVNSIKELNIGASGFVNAVLRNLLRKKNEIALPDGDSKKDLSIRFSIPENLIKMWINSYGKQNAFTLISSISVKGDTFIRANNLKTSPLNLKAILESEGVTVEICDFPDNCLKISGFGAITALESFKQGLFHVQDLSSQIACKILDPQPNEIIIDICAAPGGKSFTISEMMQNKGEIYSYDLYKGRVNLIKSGAEKLGINIINAKRNDALKPYPNENIADKVLCDVPCSGFGVIRKKPEIRYKSLDSVAELPKMQYNILQNASKLVKPGGLLMYSTCTLNLKENNQIADKFLEKNKNFEIFSIRLPDKIKRIVSEPENQLTLFPFSGASDGFFISLFKKKTK